MLPDMLGSLNVRRRTKHSRTDDAIRWCCICLRPREQRSTLIITSCMQKKKTKKNMQYE